MELVAVVMAGETSADRFNGAKKLLDYGFANYSFSSIGAELEQTEVEIDKGVKKTVEIKCDETVNILLPKNTKEEIKRVTEWNKKITAPIKKGDVLGYVSVYLGENEIGRLKITAKEEVKRLTFWVTTSWIFKELFKI